jgi:hypothetical protein
MKPERINEPSVPVDPSSSDDVDDTEKKLKFSMNERVRLGRSKDQEGKSNVWSVEPKMRVEQEEGGLVKKNLVVGGVLIAVLLASLPLLAFFGSQAPRTN